MTAMLDLDAQLAAARARATARLVQDAADRVADSWCTNRKLAKLLGRFRTDPCSNARSWIDASITYALERGQDGIGESWFGAVFVNGPYSNPLPWCERMAAHDGPCAGLWKLDPTTDWYAVLVDAGFQRRAFRDRLKFERPDKPPLTANFPSVLVFRDWTPSAELSALLWPPSL